mmetsp:Transcript_113051/g.269515  ORF Transcript_113051/g.269515 Transcript_113051/m.269515 type:complete len:220 (+) Transcript_113051:767-1426(+)
MRYAPPSARREVSMVAIRWSRGPPGQTCTASWITVALVWPLSSVRSHTTSLSSHAMKSSLGGSIALSSSRSLAPFSATKPTGTASGPEPVQTLTAVICGAGCAGGCLVHTSCMACTKSELGSSPPAARHSLKVLNQVGVCSHFQPHMKRKVPKQRSWERHSSCMPFTVNAFCVEVGSTAEPQAVRGVIQAPAAANSVSAYGLSQPALSSLAGTWSASPA